MAKQPVGMAQRFASVNQNQQIFELNNRIEDLEEELRHLRSNPPSEGEKEALNQQLEALASQLAQQSGEYHIPFDQIQPDPEQPRTVFPQDLIIARVKSLQERGQLSPVIVIPKEGWYQLFDGELRWRSGSAAGLKTLRCVFLTQENLDALDRTALFDRQLTTSIQSEKLHPFDLANALTKLMVMQYPELAPQVQEIPNLLGAVNQRLKRSGKAADLESIRIADRSTQKNWLESLGLLQMEELWILSSILDKQLNPISVSSNIFPLLNLPTDLQAVIRETGLEGSKILELKRLSPRLLNVSEEVATQIRKEITATILKNRASLSQIRKLVSQTIQEHNPVSKSIPASKLGTVVKLVQGIYPEQFDRQELTELRQALHAKLQQVEALLGPELHN
ncbi:MAG: ParB N-terminal domain-containing protein [Leptolyngbyaceae cyanobacterium bins.59]|nr:ParB N-terminal domain-containing protein [Leptolyngbyaceae cyanobacterium bins.59]